MAYAGTMSPETQAIIARLKAEGDLLRNKGTNSIKQVRVDLSKFEKHFASMSAALKENTGMIKSVSDAEMKIQQEAAERARRQGELEEVAQSDALKAAELRAKADMLRAKDELKQARGPGLFEQINKKNTLSTIKILAGLGAAGFLVGNLVTGWLDSADPKWREKTSSGLNALLNLDETIKTGFNNLSTTLSQTIKDSFDVKKILDEVGKSWVGVLASTIVGLIGSRLIFDIIKWVAASGGIGLALRSLVGAGIIGKWLDKAIKGITGKMPKPVPKTGPTPPPATSGNKTWFEKKQGTLLEQDGKPKPKPSALERQASKLFKDFEGNSLQKARGLVKLGGPTLIVSEALQEATRVNEAIEMSAEQTLGAIDLLEQERQSLKSLAINTGASAASGGLFGGLVGAGWGAAVGAGITAYRQIAITVDDLYNDIDALPNEVEKAIRRENAILNKEGVTPGQIRNSLEASVSALSESKRKLGTDVANFDNEIALLQNMLDTGEGLTEYRPRGDNSNTRSNVESRLRKAVRQRELRNTQLQNTIKVIESTGQQREAEIQRLIKVMESNAAKVSQIKNEKLQNIDRVAGNFVNTQIINNTYNQSFTSSNKNNFTQGNVNAYGNEGGEEYAMG